MGVITEVVLAIEVDIEERADLFLHDFLLYIATEWVPDRLCA